MWNWLYRWFGIEKPEPCEVEDGTLFHQAMKECPGCALRPPEYYEGPAGGMMTNIFCGRCGDGLNVSPQLEYAEKIGNNPRYIQPKYRRPWHGTA